MNDTCKYRLNNFHYKKQINEGKNFLSIAVGGDFQHTQSNGLDGTTTGGAAGPERAEGIAPVFIRQILNSPEGNFQMFDMTFSMVCIRAIIRKVDISSTKITYLLEDHSGSIDAYYWLEEGDTMKAPDVMVNQYATVYGGVRPQGERKTLMVFKMIPLKEPNELITHLLETLNAYYKAERISNKGGIDYTSSFGAAMTTGQMHNFGGGGGGQDDGLNDFTPLQRVVYQAIRAHKSEDGISRDILRRKLSHLREADLT